MGYLLDANAFITAKRLHYGFDFCPGFWDWLVSAHQNGYVYSIEKVADELTGSGDDLSAWCKDRGKAFFLPPNQQTFASFSVVSSWVTSQNYTPAAIAEFLQVADYYLIAQAHAGGHSVVTYEVPSGSTKRVKIPDVCIGLGVECINLPDMLRRGQARLVLEANP